MIATAVRLLTSPAAGPIASVAALVLALALAWQSVQLASARDSLKRAESRVEALNRDLGQCKANVAELDRGRKEQNAKIQARSDEDARQLADATKKLSEAQKGRERAEGLAAKLLKNGPVGVDACARAMDAFDRVKAGVG